MFGLKPLETRGLRKGELLIREGDPSGNKVYYLISGELLVLKSTSMIGKVKAPRFAGEISILLNCPRSASTMAYTAAHVDVYAAPDLISKLTVDRPLGMAFLQTLSDRLEMTRNRVDEYQHRILKEYAKTLVTILIERRTAAEWLKDGEASRMRKEYGLILDGRLSHKDAVEDYKVLMRLAEEKGKGVVDEYKKKLAQQFRSFVPMDLGQFKVPRLEAFRNLGEAGLKIAQTVSVLTRYLADYQRIDTGCAEWELDIIEDSVPFAEREPLLKEAVLSSSIKSTNLNDLQKRQRAYDVEILHLVEKSDPKGSPPLLPLARQFEVEEAFTKLLEKHWTERIRRHMGGGREILQNC